MDFAAIRERLNPLAQKFAAQRPTRQRRNALDPADFAALRQAGYPLVAVPEEFGGAFLDFTRSARPLSDILRLLGRSDPSLALVCAMHPAVLSVWLAAPPADAQPGADWQEQRQRLFGHVKDGAFFGTITSEPGSGGDINLTRTKAHRTEKGYAIEGQKHFGSGSGITSFMLTSAIPEGESEADWFVLDLRGASWDGTGGVAVTALWEGHGMAATQSHAVRFSGFPAERYAGPGSRKSLLPGGTSPLMGCVFASVIVGVVDSAIELSRAQLGPRRGALRPFELVELSRAEMEAWLASQALEGMLRAAEAQPPLERDVMQGKLAISELAESCLLRLCRVLGGGSYSRHSPIGYLFEDVRALGFLRPPWGLAFDLLIAAG